MNIQETNYVKRKTQNVKRKTLSIVLALMTLCAFSANAQEIIEIDPLFEYITAPEELPTIQEKSDYLVEHFWDPMDFKVKEAVDQNALNDAFRVYSVTMRWADKTKAEASIAKLIEKISKNPTLQFQFTRAAEENLYSNRAEVWIDEAYIPFLDALAKNKKVLPQRKEKYMQQLETLRNTQIGSKAHEFSFTARDGKTANYFPMATPTLIIFVDPSLAEWRMTRMKMETNIPLVQAVERGKVNIICIVPSEKPGWENEVANFPSNWTVGCAPDIRKTYDLRVTPSFYVVGADGNLVLKNSTPETSIQVILDQVK